MATTVESPGIVSAKEEAAAILFARDVQTPEIVAPAPEQSVSVHEQPTRPSFTRYHEPAAAPVRPKAVDTTDLRPYEDLTEVDVEGAQVIHPYIENNEYLTSAVAPTTVTVPTTEVAAVPVVNALDTIEEGTEYVVKLKKSTVAALAMAASVFVLMMVLLIVNIVSLVTMSAEVSALTQDSIKLSERLSQSQNTLERARANAGQGETVNYPIEYRPKEASTYTEPTDTTVEGSFFDWLCHGLSRLFN